MSVKMPWTAAIVAGGPASRLGGRDKSSLRVGDRSILDRQLSVLRPLTDRILVVANEPGRFRRLALPVVRDLVPGAAALGGIYTALTSAMTEHVLVVAGDMPFLTGPFLEHLATSAKGFDLVIPRSADGLQPMCAMYSRACLEPIRTRIAGHALRVQDLSDEVRTREIGPEELATYDPDGLLFFNVNTPADYQRALESAARLEPAPGPQDDRITHLPSRRQQSR
jgi:molybdopterin-guanine dinucleotide biosynthesis protein A